MVTDRQACLPMPYGEALTGPAPSVEKSTSWRLRARTEHLTAGLHPITLRALDPLGRTCGTCTNRIEKRNPAGRVIAHKCSTVWNPDAGPSIADDVPSTLPACHLYRE